LISITGNIIFKKNITPIYFLKPYIVLSGIDFKKFNLF